MLQAQSDEDDGDDVAVTVDSSGFMDEFFEQVRTFNVIVDACDIVIQIRDDFFGKVVFKYPWYVLYLISFQGDNYDSQKFGMCVNINNILF